MKAIILILFIWLTAGLRANAQPPAGDFDVNILMQPPTIPHENVGNLKVSTCNNGNLDIVANSLRITITVGTNAEIMGLGAGSDPRWTVLSSTTGTNNTYQLKNTGGTMTQITGANPCASITLIVKGTIAAGPSTITGTIGYIVGTNPLLGGATNASQGNSSTSNDNSTTSLIVTPGIIFPVTLISFNGKLVNNNRVDLDWQTAEEVNIEHFDVERSTNGTDYSSLGTVKSKGANSDYQLQDMKPFEGKNYYRLRIIDKDGKIRYSNVVLITLKGKTGILIYPNPSSDGNVNLSITGKGAKAIVLYDFAGRQLKSWSNYENSTLRIENLSSGSYVLSVVDIQTGNRLTERFIVNR